MQAKYDSQAKALYITLKSGVVARTIKLRDDILVDIGKNDEVLGVEFLEPVDLEGQIKNITAIPLAVT